MLRLTDKNHLSLQKNNSYLGIVVDTLVLVIAKQGFGKIEKLKIISQQLSLISNNVVKYR